MTRLFTGDFSNGRLTQWPTVHSSGPSGRSNGDYNRPTSTSPDGPGDGSVEVRRDPDCGPYLRLHLTADDSYALGGDSDWGNGTQKAQIDSINSPVYQGDTIWVAWSQKFVQFDAWPAGKTSSNFLITNEWHGKAGPRYGTSVFWGVAPWSGPWNAKTSGTPVNHWSLCVDSYDTYLGADPTERKILLNVPITLGEWIDVKMQIKWDTAANGGFIRCWINGQPKTLLGGSTTWYGQVTAPYSHIPGEYQYYAATIYRSGSGAAVNPWGDMEIHVANHRTATTEDTL